MTLFPLSLTCIERTLYFKLCTNICFNNTSVSLKITCLMLFIEEISELFMHIVNLYILLVFIN